MSQMTFRNFVLQEMMPLYVNLSVSYIYVLLYINMFFLSFFYDDVLINSDNAN
jgi:hypothetical protein